jgi:hypothetical protein
MKILEPSRSKIGSRYGDVNVMSHPDEVVVMVAYHGKKKWAT